MFFPFYFDPTFLLLIPGIILALYAQSKVQSTFQRYSRVRSMSGLTGAQVARTLLDRHGLHDVPVELVGGRLTDHYDPRSRVMRLSQEVYQSTSLAALGVAAHETGHAIQHAQNYVPLGIRNNLFPIASIGSQMAFPLFFIGLIFASTTLMNIGIWFFIAALAFQVVTLPVEFNASYRAIQLLSSTGILTSSEVPQARRVLNAAALTYVAAVAMAALQLVRLLLLRGARDD
ncbi:MAG: zinc metallopeptidase [Firmicutes bacterium]|nr:zinc metallopeptidase [Bacillota bacterium]